MPTTPLSPELMIIMAIVAVVAMMLGALLAWLFSGRGGKADTPERNAPKTEIKPVEKPAPPKPPTPEELLRRRCDEPLRLWRDRTSGALLVELDGKMYDSADKLGPEQRQAIPGLMRELGVWLGVVRTPAAPVPPATPAVSTANTPPAANKVAVPTPPHRPTAIPMSPIAASPAETVRPVPADLSAAFTPASKAPVERPKTMVEQINDLVHEMLPNSPLAGHSIRLMETPNGLLIWYDLKKFDGIDAVTDPQAQALLRAAVAAWEQRSQ